MKTVLITGANRGLGLEFCQQYAQADWQVIATCRQAEQASALNSLASQFANIQIHALDISEHTQIDGLAKNLNKTNIDLIISNAGIYGDDSRHRFGQLDYAAWQQTFTVNVMASMKIAEAFMPALERSEQGLFVAISSLMGSLADNNSGGSILYRSSKAALNAAMKSLAIDIKPQGVGVLIFHPGWVRTDMGGPNGLIDVAESITGMRQVIERFDQSQSGNFIKYDGSKMPW